MMTRRLARTALVAVLSAAALVGTGCGNKHHVTTDGETEGIWIDAGKLDYHVEGSRIVEPGVEPDASYLKGLPAGVTEPTAEEVWFAIFLRVENRTDEAVPTAKEIEIVDTDGKRFTPFGLNTDVNRFAYRPVTLAPHDVLPTPDSPEALSSFQGAELLFKLPLESYQNRPLQLVIHSADGSEPAEAEVSLDV